MDSAAWTRCQSSSILEAPPTSIPAYLPCFMASSEYSVDGINFTKLGTYNIPTRGWVDGEFTLPAEANNQPRVWVRWKGDTKELVGNSSDYDGLSIGDIFVMGESEQANDQVAPALVGSNPENNATGASATGSIVLTFNERIKAGAGNATLNGEEIAPTVNGKTAVFPYTGLDYNTAYTFTLPAGVITDRSGNAYEGVTLQFTTMERTQPVARLYDAIVAPAFIGQFGKHSTPGKFIAAMKQLGFDRVVEVAVHHRQQIALRAIFLHSPQIRMHDCFEPQSVHAQHRVPWRH